MAGNWANVDIRMTGGVPTLHRDGSPWFGWGVERPYLGDHVEAFTRLTGAGLRQIQIDCTCAEDIYHPELRFWHDHDRFDPRVQDAYFRSIADQVPADTLFMLRIGCYAPPWWTATHPGDLQVYADGSTERDLQACGRKAVPSLASPAWRNDICRALTTYLDWLESSGWSRRVSALFLCQGITWEAGFLGADGLPDYSPHAESYFRNWLTAKYRTETALSGAWGRPVILDAAAIPSPERRSRLRPEGELRRVPEEQDVIDHQQSLSDMNVDVLLALARTAREHTGGRVAIGTFYGYTLTAREQTAFTGRYGAGGFLGGHHALGRVLRSADIDFLGSPFNYADRALGTGLLFEHVPLASLQAHGKGFFDENDLYTHSGKPDGDKRVGGGLSVGCAQTVDESIRYLRLAFMQAIVRGKHQWLTELAGWIGPFRENFSDAVVLREIARLQALAEDLILRDRTPVAEVAFVLDEASVAWLPLNSAGFRDRVYHASVRWGHCGTPFDLLLLEDLTEATDTRYRLVIPACVKSPDAIANLERWLARTPSVAVDWDRRAEWYPPSDRSELLAQFAKAGVHCYVEDDSTVWANATMVGLHVGAAGRRMVRLKTPARGVEVFTGRSFAAPQGNFVWDCFEHDVALFVMEQKDTVRSLA